MNRNRAIGQQGGQRERRAARLLNSMSLAAAALPWTFNCKAVVEDISRVTRQEQSDAGAIHERIRSR